MSPRTVVLILAFVVLSLSQTPELWTHTGKIAVGSNTPFVGTFGPYNVHNTASLAVSSTPSLPLVVCIVLAQYGLPNQTQFSTDNCVFFYNSTAPFTETVALRNQEYAVGVYFTKSAKAGENATVTLTLEGDVCAAGTYWDGTTCKAAVAIAVNQKVTETFTVGETKFFTTTVSNYAGTVTFVSSGDVSATNSITWARYLAVPSADYHDEIDSGSNLTLVSPRPGVWVFGVHASEAGTSTFTLATVGCGSNSGGVGCMIPVNDSQFNVTDVVVLQQTPLFWKVEATTAYPTIISLTTNNVSEPFPVLLVSYGVIPSKENADIYNCNGDFCDVVRSISFNATEGQTEFFVGVFPVNAGNQTFGLWFNSTCVTGCQTENHGTCEVSGQCHCGMGFIGVDCATSTGLGPQYIVLIIIASLVVASAIIGFVAWAYMRRKRANYEIVS